jgi:hypothetical protein
MFKKLNFSIGVKENNGTPEVMFLIDLLSDYSIAEQGYCAVIRIIDNLLKMQKDNPLSEGYTDKMLDFRNRLENDASVYSRYQELLQTEIADEIEKPRQIPMYLRIQNLFGETLINANGHTL